ncbi:unnamed protein product [Paramecium octaurelia]|uniref:Uncharacterized protein n=1 Tax=Paramecium octaurelia TaxID=43137 RepID=A0A8S1SM12_PAROT|nr:unnamed protein product [Paramecium octaurelia]
MEFTPQSSPQGSSTEIKKQIDIKHDVEIQLNNHNLDILELKSIQNVTRFRFNYFYVRIYDRESRLQAYVRSENLKLQTFKMYIFYSSQISYQFYL